MLKIKREDITRAIRIVAKTLGTDDLTKGILMQAQEGQMILTSRRADAQSYIKIPCEGEDGVFYVPGKLFSDVVNAAMGMPDVKEITLEPEEGVVRVRVDKVLNTTVPLMNAESFTHLDQVSETVGTLVLSADIMKNAIRKVAFAASLDDAKPVLKGIYFQLAGGILKATTLDGFRMAHTEYEIASEVEADFILPSGSLSAIKDEFAGDVDITIGSKVVSFLSGGVKFMIRRLEGEYIKYAQIVPVEYKANFTGTRKEFDGLLRVMEAVIDGQEHVVIRSSEDGAQLLNKAMTTTMNMHGQWDGEDMTIGFNLKYLKAAPAEGENVMFLFSGPASPCVIKETADSKTYYLVLPVRINPETVKQ